MLSSLKDALDLDYFQCKRIMNILEESHEGKTTNFFGQYTSDILRAWYDVLKTYEKNNAYIGEAARILSQNTAYEMYVLYRVSVEIVLTFTAMVDRPCNELCSKMKSILQTTTERLRIVKRIP